MRNILALIAAATIMYGCDAATAKSGIDGYSCDISQNKLVEAQFSVCNKTSYMSSYCYEVAVKAHCTLINKAK